MTMGGGGFSSGGFVWCLNRLYLVGVMDLHDAHRGAMSVIKENQK